MEHDSSSPKTKRINVDTDKCIGCRSCEIVCSGFHASPRFSSTNPARSRIRMVIDEVNDIYLPIRATTYASAECLGRLGYTIGGKDYADCVFCGAVCPSRDLFFEPDTGLPLRCDLCEDDPTLAEPMCVQVCKTGALTYEELGGERQGEARPGDLETGLERLVAKFGMRLVCDTAARKGRPRRGR